jgi:pimeloyl-ACP methyl ester carboxylesterase
MRLRAAASQVVGVLVVVLFWTAPPTTQSRSAVASPTSLAAAPELQFQDQALTLRYRDIGAGSPVLLVHGFAGRLENWIGLADRLATAHRVLAVDLRGFGHSSKSADPKQFGEAMADDLVRLLDHLRIVRAHFIGHSMGALLVANTAARQPARLRTATLIAGPFFADRQRFEREVAPWIADLEDGRGVTGMVRWLVPSLDQNAARQFSRGTLASNDVPSLIAVLRALPEVVVPPAQALRVPTLIAVGSGDPLLPLSEAVAASSARPRFLTIPRTDRSMCSIVPFCSTRSAS